MLKLFKNKKIQEKSLAYWEGSLKPISGTINKSNISMIFQDPYNSFHPTYTIFEQIKDVIKNNYKKEELDEFLLKLSLDRNLLNKKPHELSVNYKDAQFCEHF